MQRMFRSVGLLLLGAALITPASVRAGVLSQERHGDKDDKDKDKRKRVYDRDRRDYHDWDDREERAYRHWLEERREAYREHERLERARMNEYWRWRHEHLDWDGPRHVYDWNGRAWRDWDDREDRAYLHWLQEVRHERFIEYERLERARQIAYWRWRHEHADWERDRR